MTRWNLDPAVIGGLALFAIGYAAQAGHLAVRRRVSFTAAITLLAILFVSPLCALASALFSARVIHHVMLGLVIAPLLVASLPVERLRVRGSAATWTGVQAFLFWLWHAPPIYAWSLSSDLAYWLMQTSLLVSAGGFWAEIRRSSTPTAVAALLATMVQMGLLGALITFSGSALYLPHLLSTRAWGLSPLEDQQLAGLVMWVPAAGLYLGAAMVLCGRWLAGEQPRVPAP